MEPQLLTLAEAAVYLGLPVEQVRKLAEHRVLPAVRDGDDWIFRRALITRWKQAQPPAEDSPGQRLRSAQQKLGGLVQPKLPVGSTSSFDLSVINELDIPDEL